VKSLARAAATRLDAIAAWRSLMVCLLVIFGLSSIPNNFQPSDSPIPADKIAHGIEFAALGAILAVMLHRRWPKQPRAAIVAAAALLSTLYGVTDELHQSFVPGRDVSVSDLGADAAGAVAGAITAATLPRRSSQRLEP
jgi:VanZ family protein